MLRHLVCLRYWSERPHEVRPAPYGYANIQARSLSSHVASNDLVIAQPPG